MIKDIGRLIAWISGSVAGITAVLYAIGFLATKASEGVLGIGVDFTDQDHFTQVSRGASVIARTAIPAVWPALALVGLARGIRWLIGRWKGEAAQGVQARLGTVLVPVGAVLILAVAVGALAVNVGAALDVKGMLFTPVTKMDVCPDGDLRLAVLSQHSDVLKTAFNHFALWIGVLVGFGILIQRDLIAQKIRLWQFIGGVGAALALIMTPVAYGILVLEKKAPAVMIEPPPDDAPGTMRLLSRAGDGVLVWLEDRREVRWIARGKVDVMTIGRTKTIRAVECPAETDAGE